MRKEVRFGLMGFATLAILLSSASCGKDKTTATEEVRIEKIRTQKVLNKEIEREVECTGVLEGYETMNVSPFVTGIIQKRYKDVGDRVATGDLLVVMDQTQLKTAKLQLSNLETEMKRMNALLAGGNVTQQVYDQTKLQYDQAKEQYDFLNANTNFKASFPGIVSERNYESGELYNGAKPIITVVQINTLKVIINVPEAYFTKVKQGMKMDIISELYPNQTFPGVIEVIYPTIDAATHTFQCKVKIPNGNMKLRPGMYIHTTVPAGKQTVTVVPFQSVLKLTGSNERFLFLSENGVAKRITVKIGERFNNDLEVIGDGLYDGADVVTQGQTRLIDGIQVEVMNSTYEEEAAAKTAAEKGETVEPTKKDSSVKACTAAPAKEDSVVKK